MINGALNSISLSLFILLLLTYETPAQAAGECEPWLVRIVSVEGEVEARRMGHPAWSSVHLDEVFCSGDSIRVGQHSRAVILLHHEQTTLNLDQGTTLTFTEEEQETTWLDMLKGAIHFISRTPRTLKVKTPYVNAAVEGTEFLVRIEPARTLLWVFEGRVLASNQTGNLTLASNQGAIAKAGEAPRSYVLVNPRNAVQWALYYPPVIDYGTKERTTVLSSGIRQALQQYRQGDVAQALTSLDSVPAAQRDTRYYTLRAYLLLKVGRVDEALPSLRLALERDPRNGIAVALQAIIALVQNDKNTALTLARRAVEFSPQVAVPYIASSYVQQAAFDLDEALASAEQAVRLSPDDALAWTRIAELQLANGNLEGTLTAAQQAVHLNPELARTQTVLGFAHLTRIETRQAETAFNRAVQLDSADPLPRLGQGLVLVRQGNLKTGRQLLEIATSLDSNRSLIRSYLGKVYYEEMRNELAGTELAIAKELDPRDPTPWFYDAIRKQTQNRPVEALEDLQQSIELNDSRAIYRSQLQLDQDLAARSANLALIYNDLGFQQRALVEGWKSINIDPGNFSAHRFLADAYASLPRHEIARVSEVLQAQLLQPINLNPVRPLAAETRIFSLNNRGIASPGFNEFNSLFNRNGTSLLATALVGGQDTLSDELILSGIWGPVSYSLGQFHFESNGFRENNDETRNIYNLFAQVALSHKTSMQGELRYSESESGDLNRLFDPDNFLRNLRESTQARSARFGLRHRFDPRNDLLISASYTDQNTTVEPNTLEQQGPGLEIQHLYRSSRFDIISGTGHFELDQRFLRRGITTSDNNERHSNFYSYTYIRYPQPMIWTLGASADFFREDITERDQFNPKLGLLWNLSTNTTLRVAAFRTLKRTLSLQQTLEPTQVAGFNQFFDDGTGTDARRYGIGIDYRFSSYLYGGTEFSKRDLNTPGLIFTPPASFTAAEFDLEEYLGRLYLYVIPHSWLALSAEYLWERFERPPEGQGPERITKLDTHRLDLGINFFHPSGFRADITPRYIVQKGKFGVGPIDIVPDEDRFWIVDLGIGYRLPRRLGLIGLEIKNLFDKDFKFQSTDLNKPEIEPERLILGTITLAF